MSQLFAGQAVTIDGDDVDVRSLAYDSRAVESGALFAAMVGARSDGHDHIPQALERGAVAVLTERAADVGSATRIEARDSRRSLAEVARVFYGDPAADLMMVGVTGTNGKTTTIHLLESILATGGRKVGLLGTLGARFGGRRIDTGLTTPESIDLLEQLDAMREYGADTVAMEVSSHALHQHRVAGVSYDVGIFTNLTRDHLDYHGTFEAYFEAKAMLLRERLKLSGQAVVNLDDARVASLAAELPRVLTFSTRDPAADVYATRVELDRRGITVALATPGGDYTIRSPLIGRFNVENIMAAAAGAFAVGMGSMVIVGGISQVTSVAGRLERVSGDDEPLVLVDYAHTPDALTQALDAAREVTPGRVICVFGCGGDRDAGKRAPMGRAAARGSDVPVLTNDNPRTEDPQAIAVGVRVGLDEVGTPYEVILDRAAAIERAIGGASAADTVVIAGKGHEDYQIVGTERRDFDDRAHAREVLDRITERSNPEESNE